MDVASVSSGVAGALVASAITWTARAVTRAARGIATELHGLACDMRDAAQRIGMLERTMGQILAKLHQGEGYAANPPQR